jgi:hypothetical protein
MDGKTGVKIIYLLSGSVVHDVGEGLILNYVFGDKIYCDTNMLGEENHAVVFHGRTESRSGDPSNKILRMWTLFFPDRKRPSLQSSGTTTVVFDTEGTFE